LREAALVEENNFYSDCGCLAFMEAAARYMGRVFDVTVEAEVELLPSMGSKNALTYVALAFLDPGDVLLTTTPGYPVLPTFAQYLGAEVVSLPLRGENQFFPDLSQSSPSLRKRAKILHLNYPNNPTGACGTLDFFAEAVEFCRKNSLILVHDAAYAGLWDDLCPARSIFQIPGAMDLALELHSCSKAHAMTGWRIGWICGQQKFIAAYRRIKETCDSGQFLPIQHGAIVALDDDAFCADAMVEQRARMGVIEKILGERGFTFPAHHHPFYVYASAPVEADGIRFGTAQEFSEWLLERCGILTVPWDEVDPSVRFSTTIPLPADSLERLLRERIGNLRFTF
jgi:LL-diaminopimelate aminotransferase